MKTINTHQLVQRTHGEALETPIHVGDTVYLKLADGTEVRSVVIFDTPISGDIIYTADAVDRAGFRARFRETAVHAVESARAMARAVNNAVYA